MRRFISLLIAVFVFVAMQWGVKEINAIAVETYKMFPYGYLAMLVRIFGYQLIAILLLKDILYRRFRLLLPHSKARPAPVQNSLLTDKCKIPK